MIKHTFVRQSKEGLYGVFIGKVTEKWVTE